MDINNGDRVPEMAARVSLAMGAPYTYNIISYHTISYLPYHTYINNVDRVPEMAALLSSDTGAPYIYHIIPYHTIP